MMGACCSPLWLACLLAFLQVEGVGSMNARPGCLPFRQPDGTVTRPLCLQGNELCSYLQDMHGFTVIEASDGWLVYATKNATGNLVPSDVKVDLKTIPSQHNLVPNLVPPSCAVDTAQSRTADDETGTSSSLQGRFVGTWRHLVIPVLFSNHKTRTLPTKDNITQFFNHPGPITDIAPHGSVRDWYKTNSYNRFDLVSVVADWVELDQPESYYASDDVAVNIDNDKMAELVTSVLDRLEEQSFPFATWSGSGTGGDYIGVSLFHSGYGSEYGGEDCDGTLPKARLFSHVWTVNWSSAKTGVEFSRYALVPAFFGNCGNEMQRLLPAAHEIGHFLGLNDMYGRLGSRGAGVGAWDVMGNAFSFDNQGQRGIFSAYSKIKLGWIEPKVLDANGIYSLRSSTISDEVYRIDVGFPSKEEYLLIESRQPMGLDAVVKLGGLAIYHIDESRGYTDEDKYPGHPDYPASHSRVVLLQADGKYELQKRADAGDLLDLYRDGQELLPGGNDEGGGPYPNSDSYLNGVIKQTGIEIKDISPPSGYNMSFSFYSPLLVSDNQFTNPQLSPGASISPTNTGRCDLKAELRCIITATGENCDEFKAPKAVIMFGNQCSANATYVLNISNVAPQDERIKTIMWRHEGEALSDIPRGFTIAAGADYVYEKHLELNFCNAFASYSSLRITADRDGVCATGTSYSFETGASECIHLTDFWDSGFGGCESYRHDVEGSNYQFCAVDTDPITGILAKDACKECNQCVQTSVGIPCYKSGITFDAGYGTCDTYAPDKTNHLYCDFDEDFFMSEDGVVASAACLSVRSVSTVRQVHCCNTHIVATLVAGQESNAGTSEAKAGGADDIASHPDAKKK